MTSDPLLLRSRETLAKYFVFKFRICIYIKVWGNSDQKLLRSMTAKWPLTPYLLRSHVWLYPRTMCSNSHKNTSKHLVTLFSKTSNFEVQDQYMTFDPNSTEVTCVSLTKNHCIQVHGNTSTYVKTVIIL